jgi:hypothetical protein
VVYPYAFIVNRGVLVFLCVYTATKAIRFFAVFIVWAKNRAELFFNADIVRQYNFFAGFCMNTCVFLAFTS